MRKVFCEGLPRRGKTNQINWKESIGCEVKFTYDDIEGEIEIIDYLANGNKLTIKYDRKIYKIRRGEFVSCKLGIMLDKRSNKFRVNIGQVFTDDKRDFIITDSQYREQRRNRTIEKRKWYKYTCNKCGWADGWIEENKLLNGRGCGCCSSASKNVIYGINSIHDTAPWMISLGVDFEEAKKFTYNSGKKIKCVCPHCKEVTHKVVYGIYNGKSIGCICSDGHSYPEKFMYSLLRQIKLEFETQYNPKWTERKFYDFYIPSLNVIIETHGLQHYEQSSRGRLLHEEQENDKIKKELALNSGVNYYIELDCRKSELDWIKNSVLNSELSKLFDLSKIDWLKCEEFAIKSNKIKEICDYWNNKEDVEATSDLARVFNINRSIICIYLKKGAKLGWCDYDTKEELRKSKLKNKKRKAINIFKEGKMLKTFESCAELERQSEDVFGVKLYNTMVSKVANGIIEQYKGFTFQYI